MFVDAGARHCGHPMTSLDIRQTIFSPVCTLDRPVSTLDIECAYSPI
jgi:hypothetical protein